MSEYWACQGTTEHFGFSVYGGVKGFGVWGLGPRVLGIRVLRL